MVACAAIVVLVAGSSVGVTSATAAETGTQVSASQLLTELRLAAPSTVRYDRDLFAEGVDADEDGCNTRREVLQIEAVLAPEVGDGCTITGGGWFSWYDGVSVSDQSELEMDHLVALKEAWVSGAYAWTDSQRSAFANDLDIPETLNAVTSAVNQAKSDKDPAGWMPPLADVHCRYVGEWITVKYRWNLSVDPAEKSAIEGVLAGCGSLTITVPPAGGSGVPDATAYYTTRYDGSIYAVTSASTTLLTFAQWQAAGAPTPVPAAVDYFTYAWAPTIIARPLIPNLGSVRVTLSPAQWTRAGNPAPRLEWVEGLQYYQWQGTAQILVRLAAVNNAKHPVSYAQWAASGFRPFLKISNQGFVKLSWDPHIAFLTDYAAGKGGPIDAARWRAEGNSTPTVKTRFPGDIVYQNYGNPTIWYAGPTVNRPISYNEWRIMGFPSPIMRGTPPTPPPTTTPGTPPPPTRPPNPGDTKNCSDFPTQAAAQAAYNYYVALGYGDVFQLDGNDHDGKACESLP